MRKALSFFKTSQKLNFYDSIEVLPVSNWFNIHKTNDLTFLLKKKHEVKPNQLIILEVAWNNIFFEFITEFGVPPGMKESLELKRDIMALKIRMLSEKDPSLQTFIEIKEFELNQFNSDAEMSE